MKLLFLLVQLLLLRIAAANASGVPSNATLNRCNQDVLCPCVVVQQGQNGQNGRDGRDGLPGSSGRDGKEGEKGDPGELGPQGPPGDSGLPGPTGPQGTEGRAGEKGDTGPRGLRGEPGVQGPAGMLGLRGPRGEHGLQGSKGDTGPRGLQGPKGDRGSRPVGWTSVPLNHIGFSNLRSANTVSFRIPSVIPNAATEVLVYAYFRAGLCHPHEAVSHLKIYTENNNQRYEKYVTLVCYQSRIGWDVNSENLWFPMPSNRRIYLQSPRVHRDYIEANLYTIGYH